VHLDAPRLIWNTNIDPSKKLFGSSGTTIGEPNHVPEATPIVNAPSSLPFGANSILKERVESSGPWNKSTMLKLVSSLASVGLPTKSEPESQQRVKPGPRHSTSSTTLRSYTLIKSTTPVGETRAKKLFLISSAGNCVEPICSLLPEVCPE